MINIHYLSKNCVIALFSFLLIFGPAACVERKAELEISIVTDHIPGKPVLHALAKVTDKLISKKVTFEIVNSLDDAHGKSVIVTGLANGEGAASQMLKAVNRNVPKISEALTIWRTDWQEKSVWVVCGFDDRGLMYGLLDVADRISWSTDPTLPLSEVKEITEKPDVTERAISIYTMQRKYWEIRLYDEKYWERYLDMLAKNRFNSLVVIFGYENGGFMAPCYPYFFDVDGFPDVKMVGLTPEQQKQNLNAFNRLIEMAHERGIKFQAGIWDHIYRGGVQSGGIEGAEKVPDKPVDGLVWGLDNDNLVPYTKAALASFIKLVPDLDGIQFRIHNESGIEDDEQADFWMDIFQLIRETSPDMSIVLRAKGMQESVIQSALDADINFSIGTKYWMEQMGMPYHPTHVNPQNQFDRRHGYADMLKYPQQYKMLWRLWNGGTTRILLWANPEYARRFAESTHLYHGNGFEINEPLATKMEAQPHDMLPFDLLTPHIENPSFSAVEAEQVPAFPGAEGYGAFAKGGRGGQVIQVTNLLDYVPGKEEIIPGSLRAAIEQKGPRIIVFRVAGTIDLKAILDINEPFCTIAGQSAPSGGICTRNYQIGINTNDVVIRYLRSRPGPGPHYDYEHHSVETDGCRNVILDHCSLTWGTDEALTFARSSDATVQWCIIGQGLNISTHAEGAHSKATMVAHGSTRTTYHHNLIVHSYDRNPRIHSLPKDQVDELILNDFRNNVIYNASEADVNGRLNFVGNLYLPGPNFREMYCLNTIEPNQIYLYDNIGPTRTSSNMPQTKAMRSTGKVNLVDRPFDTPQVETQPASEILNLVLENVGAILPQRDSLDSVIVTDVKERKGKIIDHPAEVGGWPVLRPGESYPDNNKNGMSDQWERQYGFDQDDPTSGNQDPDEDGYTNIEEFLNGTNPMVKEL